MHGSTAVSLGLPFAHGSMETLWHQQRKCECGRRLPRSRACTSCYARVCERSSEGMSASGAANIIENKWAGWVETIGRRSDLEQQHEASRETLTCLTSATASDTSTLVFSRLSLVVFSFTLFLFFPRLDVFLLVVVRTLSRARPPHFSSLRICRYNSLSPYRRFVLFLLCVCVCVCVSVMLTFGSCALLVPPSSVLMGVVAAPAPPVGLSCCVLPRVPALCPPHPSSFFPLCFSL